MGRETKPGIGATSFEETLQEVRRCRVERWAAEDERETEAAQVVRAMRETVDRLTAIAVQLEEQTRSLTRRVQALERAEAARRPIGPPPIRVVPVDAGNLTDAQIEFLKSKLPHVALTRQEADD